jgi:hypothetical protein
MDKHIYKILDPLYQDVMGTSIDDKTYHMLAKNVRVDRSPASLARIRESLVISRDNFHAAITSPADRKVIFLKNAEQLVETDSILNNKNILIISVITKDTLPSAFEKFIFDDLTASGFFVQVMFYFVTTSPAIYDSLSQRPHSHGFLIPEHMVTSLDFTNNNILAHFKNRCYQIAKDQFKDESIDWLVYLDSKWSEINLDGFLSSFKSCPKNCDVICGNRTFKKSYVHADALELFLLEDGDMTLSEKYPYLERFSKTLYWMDKFYSFETWFKVKSAFGGVLILNKKALCLDALFDEENAPNVSENISICTKFLNVYVNPKMRLYLPTSVEGILYPNAALYIPSDVNLCASLNRYIRCLASGARIYPYFNSGIIAEKNKFNPSNFIYHDPTIENSWMSFFQPVEFYDNDVTHMISKDLLLLSHIHNDEYPDIGMDTDLWHKFIRFSEPILSRITVFPRDDNETIIGVIYNHPVTFLKTQVTLFKDYFYELDVMLEASPNSKVFLYTDTELAIAAFTSQYKDILIYDPKFQRLSLDHTILWGQYNKIQINENTTEYPTTREKIDRGIDELSGVASLAKCEWLICPKNCQVGKTCLIINPEIKTVYL